jgi:NADH-quinone oxidoreductase subunit J
MSVAQISFFVAAAVAVASALGVVIFRNAVYCMLSLILNLLSLAFFFLLLNAMFVATIQVLIYAGAVMILFLFVVTMLSPDTSDTDGRDRLGWQWIAGAGCGIILAGALIIALTSGSLSRDAKVAGMNGLAEATARFGNTQVFGLALFHGFSFPFELTSALLVVAALGAVVLGRRLTTR